MEVARVSVLMVTVLALIFSLCFPVTAATLSPAPAPSPTSDGTAIDQGVAYVLMLVALAVTYLIH